MLEPHTSWRKGGQAKNTEKRQNITTTKTQCTQMPKSNRNGYKNGKQTYLLVQGTKVSKQCKNGFQFVNNNRLKCFLKMLENGKKMLFTI